MENLPYPQIEPKVYAVVATSIELGFDHSKWGLNDEVGCELLSKYRPKLNNMSSTQRTTIFNYCTQQLTSLPDFFAYLRASSESYSVAKKRGAVYTPQWLAQRISVNTMRHWRKLHRSGKPPTAIADLSCGTGTFLYSISELLDDKVDIFGIDVDDDALFYAQLLSHLCKHDWELTSGDSLNEWNAFNSSLLTYSLHNPRRFDILIGNPPYVRAQTLQPNYRSQLKLNYPQFTKGNFDLSTLFLKQAVDFLAPGGIAAYLVSSKFANSQYGKAICNYIYKNARLINIEDYGDLQLFDNQTTYTCVLTFANMPPAKRFTVTQFLSEFEKSSKLEKANSYTLPTERLAEHPWDFTHGIVNDSLNKMRERNHPLLLDVFDSITQGVRTGSNQLFLTKQNEQIEPAHLIPFVSGEDIRQFQINDDHSQLIFPYKIDVFKNAHLLTEGELEQKEGLYAHLKQHQLSLSARVNDVGAWYAFSRSQNLNVFAARKILIKEMMPQAEFAADTEGKFAFSSGYALLTRYLPDEEIRLWTAVLNTKTMEFSLRHHSTQLHSGWFRLLKHHLKRIRLPSLSATQKRTALQLSEQLHDNPQDSQSLEALNDLVADAFQLMDSERLAIEKFLVECHKRSMPNPQARQFAVIKPSNKYEPIKLAQYEKYHVERHDLRKSVTFVPNKSLPIHRWYPYTQGFSAPLVTELLNYFKVTTKHLILDPFTGSGTTNVVCRLANIPSIGVEISPLAAWLATIKTRHWNQDELLAVNLPSSTTSKVSKQVAGKLFQRYLAKAYDEEILEQLNEIAKYAQTQPITEAQKDYLLVGLIGITEKVSKVRKHGSHYRFMDASENIGLQKLNIQLISQGADVYSIYQAQLAQILADISGCPMPMSGAGATILNETVFQMSIEDESADFVITSPPYLNRNNYLAQQKAELALLEMLQDVTEYKALVRRTMRSHVEGIYEKEPKTQFEEVKSILDSIELTDGNNKKIPHMIAGYFEDLNKILQELARVVKKGGKCAFVVGNSRWGGVVVPVDHLLLKIAEQHGFVPERIFITRMKGNSPQQMRRYGRIPVRESVVIFQKV